MRILMLALLASLLLPSEASEAQRPPPSKSEVERLRLRVTDLEARLDAEKEARDRQADALDAATNRVELVTDAEKEARDRQADAFDAAIKQVELVNGALAIVLALGGIAATVLGLRWVRSYTEQRVADRIDESIRQSGTEIFAREAATLVEEYDLRFAEAYAKYHGLIERDG